MAGSKGGAPLDFNNFPTPTVTGQKDLCSVTHFIVTMNQYTYSFSEIDGLEINTPFETYREGGVNDHAIFVTMPGNGDIKTLTFKRGMVIKGQALVTNLMKVGAANIPIHEARKAALQAINMLSPVASLESGPTPGTIEVYSREKLVASFRFMSIGLTQWSIGGLDAKSGEILIETIQIAHTGLIRNPIVNFSSGENFASALTSQFKNAYDSAINIVQSVPQIFSHGKNSTETNEKNPSAIIYTDQKEIKYEDNPNAIIPAETKEKVDKTKEDLNNAEKEYNNAENAYNNAEKELQKFKKGNNISDENKDSLDENLKNELGYLEKNLENSKANLEDKRQKAENLDNELEKISKDYENNLNDKLQELYKDFQNTEDPEKLEEIKSQINEIKNEKNKFYNEQLEKIAQKITQNDLDLAIANATGDEESSDSYKTNKAKLEKKAEEIEKKIA